MAHNQTLLQDIKESFEDVYWGAKMYGISSDPMRNSTTVIALIHMYTYCETKTQENPT